MKFLLTLGRGSERIGFVPTVLCAITWLACGAIGTRAVVESLWQSPRLAEVVGLVIATIVGIGGIVSFYLIVHHVDYLSRG